ncbi:MAG: hypothetical protein ACXVDA_14575 [Ktedonobacterales bacterium]
MTPEGRVKAAVKKILKRYGDDLYYEMPVPTGFGKSGLDFHICFHGHYIAIETKAPKKEPTPRQDHTIAQIKKAGGTVLVIDSVESTTSLVRLLEYIHPQAKHAGTSQSQTQAAGGSGNTGGPEPLSPGQSDRLQQRPDAADPSHAH